MGSLVANIHDTLVSDWPTNGPCRTIDKTQTLGLREPLWHEWPLIVFSGLLTQDLVIRKRAGKDHTSGLLSEKEITFFYKTKNFLKQLFKFNYLSYDQA